MTTDTASENPSTATKFRVWKNFLQHRLFAVSIGATHTHDHYTIPLLPDSSPPPLLVSPAAASVHVENSELEAHVDHILSLASEEPFEDGMENRTSQALEVFISEYSVAGVQDLGCRLQAESMNQGVAADVVRVLGQLEHPPSRSERLYTASCLLYSELPLARDSAALALADINDPASVPELERAIDNEPIPALRADMQLALDQVRSGDAAPAQEA